MQLSQTSHDADKTSLYSRWKMHMEAGGMAEQEGLYVAAARNYRTALALAETLGLFDEDMAPNLLGLAACLCKLGNFQEAERIYKRLLEVDEAMLGSQNSDFAMDLNDLSELYVKEGRIGEGERLLGCALNILETIQPGSPLELATTLKNLAELYSQRNNFKEAEKFLARASTICETGNRKRTKLYAEILLNKAKLAAKRSKYDVANELLNQAIETLELVTGGNHRELSDFLKTAAEIMDQEGLTSRAQLLTQKAKDMSAHIAQIDR